LKKELTNGDVELRLHLRNHFQELIEKIEVFSHGRKNQYEGRRGEDTRDAETLAESIEAGMSDSNPDWEPDDQYRDFMKFITELRMSKAGRFLRIHFKTGARADVVPEGSFASGKELVCADGRRKRGWRVVRPDLEDLWTKFEVAKRRSK
jgi:hypothetical protein